MVCVSLLILLTFFPNFSATAVNDHPCTTEPKGLMWHNLLAHCHDPPPCHPYDDDGPSRYEYHLASDPANELEFPAPSHLDNAGELQWGNSVSGLAVRRRPVVLGGDLNGAEQRNQEANIQSRPQLNNSSTVRRSMRSNTSTSFLSCQSYWTAGDSVRKFLSSTQVRLLELLSEETRRVILRLWGCDPDATSNTTTDLPTREHSARGQDLPRGSSIEWCQTWLRGQFAVGSESDSGTLLDEADLIARASGDERDDLCKDVTPKLSKITSFVDCDTINSDCDKLPIPTLPSEAPATGVSEYETASCNSGFASARSKTGVTGLHKNVRLVCPWCTLSYYQLVGDINEIGDFKFASLEKGVGNKKTGKEDAGQVSRQSEVLSVGGSNNQHDTLQTKSDEAAVKENQQHTPQSRESAQSGKHQTAGSEYWMKSQSWDAVGIHRGDRVSKHTNCKECRRISYLADETSNKHPSSTRDGEDLEPSESQIPPVAAYSLNIQERISSATLPLATVKKSQPCTTGDGELANACGKNLNINHTVSHSSTSAVQNAKLVNKTFLFRKDRAFSPNSQSDSVDSSPVSDSTTLSHSSQDKTQNKSKDERPAGLQERPLLSSLNTLPMTHSHEKKAVHFTEETSVTSVPPASLKEAISPVLDINGPPSSLKSDATDSPKGQKDENVDSCQREVEVAFPSLPTVAVNHANSAHTSVRADHLVTELHSVPRPGIGIKAELEPETTRAEDIENESQKEP